MSNFPEPEQEEFLESSETHLFDPSKRFKPNSYHVESPLLNVQYIVPHFNYLFQQFAALTQIEPYPLDDIQKLQGIITESLDSIFSKPYNLGQTFLLETHHRRISLDNLVTTKKPKSESTQDTSNTSNTLQSSSPSSSTKRKNRHRTISLNLSELFSFSSNLLNLFKNKELSSTICQSFIKSCSKCLNTLSSSDSSVLLAAAPARIVIILCFFAQLFKHEYCFPLVTNPLLYFVHSLPPKMKARIHLALTHVPKIVLRHLLQMTHNVINSSVNSFSSPKLFYKKNTLHYSLDFMRILFRISRTVRFASYELFYNDKINNSLPLNLEFHYWQNENKSLFSFLRFFPFVLNPYSKYSILQGEHYFVQLSLKNQRNNQNILQNYFGNPLDARQDPIYCILRVRRSHLIQDTLSQLYSQSSHTTKLTLKIHFIDEPGIDQGGLRQEFFRLLIQKFFDTSYSMFQLQDESSLFWFYPYTFESPAIYRLFGTIVGLALYNSTTLDLHFPLYLYRLMITPPKNLLPRSGGTDTNNVSYNENIASTSVAHPHIGGNPNSPSTSDIPTVNLQNLQNPRDSPPLTLRLLSPRSKNIPIDDKLAHLDIDPHTNPNQSTFNSPISSQPSHPPKTLKYDDLPPPSLSEFTELFPTTGKSFEKLLNMDPDLIEQTLCSNFTIALDCYGKKVVHPLIKNGTNIPVTGSNLSHFIQLYISHRMIHSVGDSLYSFLSGFKFIVDSPILQTTLPKELRTMIIGERTLDFTALQNHTQYTGYVQSDSVVVNFWDIVHNQMNFQQQRKLLSFVTGNDRAPPGGLEKLPFKIQKNGNFNFHQLPTSHACFNTLLLPPYPTKEILFNNLSIALDNCNGFGLI